MALHFEIKVNGLPIGHVHIRRLEVLLAGKLLEYEYEVEYPTLKVTRGNVRHRYSDGALVLITKVFKDIAKQDKEDYLDG